jgi:hypothetical protein
MFKDEQQRYRVVKILLTRIECGYWFDETQGTFVQVDSQSNRYRYEQLSSSEKFIYDFAFGLIDLDHKFSFWRGITKLDLENRGMIAGLLSAVDRGVVSLWIKKYDAISP